MSKKDYRKKWKFGFRRVRWTINFDKHLNALTMEDSPYYDEKFVNDIINEFGSIKKYKESEK